MTFLFDLILLGIVNLICPARRNEAPGGDFIFMGGSGQQDNSDSSQSQYQYFEVPEVHDAYDFEEGGDIEF